MMHVETLYTVTVKRDNRKATRVILPSLADALEAARTDATWHRGCASVVISPVLYVSRVDEVTS